MATANKKQAAPLTTAGRAAAIVVALGSINASHIYKHLREEEIEKLTLEVSKLEDLPPEEMQSIIEEFYGLCMTTKVVSEGGVVYAKDILEKAFGQQQAANYMDRVSQAMKVRALEFIRKANYKNILMIVQHEHPQTIAFILSYAKAAQASKVIAELPKDLQIEVVRRIASLESVRPEVIGTLERILEGKFSNVMSQDAVEVGGVTYVADIMNSIDRASEKHIFSELTKSDASLSEEIRKLMFIFDDIITLDDMSIQRVLRDIDQQDLAVAIKGSSEEVKASLLDNVSARARESILEDIQYLKNLRLKDVEEAQQKIVSVIRKLEEEGEIVVSKGGDDDVIIG